jgi:hypothetical protein
MSENERFGLVLAKTGSINSGTGPQNFSYFTYIHSPSCCLSWIFTYIPPSDPAGCVHVRRVGEEPAAVLQAAARGQLPSCLSTFMTDNSPLLTSQDVSMFAESEKNRQLASKLLHAASCRF